MAGDIDHLQQYLTGGADQKKEKASPGLIEQLGEYFDSGKKSKGASEQPIIIGQPGSTLGEIASKMAGTPDIGGG